LGKYDADFFQHDIDMPSQINYQKLLRDQEWKSIIQIKIENFFLG
jgi:hypothetical protein